MPPVYRTQWRAKITIDGISYYACKDDLPLPRVKWKLFKEEYPDTFTRHQADMIVAFYSDQQVELVSVMLLPTEDT